MKKNAILSFILWYLPVAAVQLLSGSFTASSLEPWYENLTKASWAPPDWIFGPAWTLLYILMTIAVWKVYHSKTTSHLKLKAYTLFFVQLFLNGLWSYLFFGLQMPGWALLELGTLIVFITLTASTFFKIDQSTAFLLLPYLIWCLYAFTLNAAIWSLN